MSRGPVAWDAAAYERLSDPQFQWALEVLDWRKWRGDEHVLDAGCGPGRVTQEILRRVPRGHVRAVDRDPDMLAKARTRLATFGPRVEVLEADLATLFELGAVDVVVSTAVLHWIPDHAAVFRGFHRVLRPGGELMAQFGGTGNIASLLRLAEDVQALPAFAPAFAGWTPPWHFESAETTADLVQAAGFADVRTKLEARRPGFPGRPEFLAFCATAPLRPHLGRLGPSKQEEFLEAVGDAWEIARLPWELDYVRLNVRARRPA